MSVIKNVEWMCTHCGAKINKSELAGRPAPGKCPKKSGNKPHTWVVNKKY